MGYCNCFGQSAKTIKNSSGGCFACRGQLSGLPKTLKMGLLYPPCFPLVQAKLKSDPFEPMTTPDQCIVAFTGDCAIDATEWTEDRKAPVYTDVIVIKQCINVPADEEGNPVFTAEDIEAMDQGHNCCIRFIDQQECATAPAYVIAQNEGVKSAS